MRNLLQDLRFALRQMRRTPGFAFTAVLTLTFGIAANVIVFAVMQAMLLAPIDVPNAKQVMTDHITTVVKHYAGKVYSWDVVNEPIYHDNRPDGLRRKPWLDFIGPQYIDIAFRTAHAADPNARLVLNECYIEHNTPAEIGRRADLPVPNIDVISSFKMPMG